MQDAPQDLDAIIAAVERLRPWSDRFVVADELSPLLLPFGIMAGDVGALASELASLGRVYPQLPAETVVRLLGSVERNIAAGRMVDDDGPLPSVATMLVGHGLPRSTAYDYDKRYRKSPLGRRDTNALIADLGAALEAWQDRTERRATIAEEQAAGKSYGAARQHERVTRAERR